MVADGETCFINNIVLCELVWVIESAYKYKKEEIADFLEKLLSTSLFELESKEAAWWALREYKKSSKAEFSDCLISRQNKIQGCTETVSFDKGVKSVEGFKILDRSRLTTKRSGDNMTAVTTNLSQFLELTDEQFYELCQNNRDLRIERTSKGELVIMPPTGWETGNRNIKLSQQLANWADTNDLGIAFDSSTGFKLPNGADVSPDASWVRRDRLDALTPEQKRGFLRLCPDFVVELRSASDSLKKLQAKLEEYRENGAQLGWLIDPKTRQVEIYRPGRDVEILSNPETLSGEEILPGFVLDLRPIFRNL